MKDLSPTECQSNLTSASPRYISTNFFGKLLIFKFAITHCFLRLFEVLGCNPKINFDLFQVQTLYSTGKSYFLTTGIFFAIRIIWIRLLTVCPEGNNTLKDSLDNAWHLFVWWYINVWTRPTYIHTYINFIYPRILV